MENPEYLCIPIQKIVDIIETSETERTIVVDASVFRSVVIKLVDDIQYTREFRSQIRRLEEIFSKLIQYRNEVGYVPEELENEFYQQYKQLMTLINTKFKLKETAEQMLLDIFKGYTLLVPAYKANVDSYILKALSKDQFPNIRYSLVHYVVNELYYNSRLNLVIQNMGSLDLANSKFAIISTNMNYLRGKEVGKFDFSSITTKKEELKRKLLSSQKAQGIFIILQLLSKHIGKAILGIPLDDVLLGIYGIFLIDP